MLDAAVRTGRIEDLAHVRNLIRGRPGCVVAAGWLDLVDARAESPLETRARLLLTDAGIAPEELQWPVTAGPPGVERVIARLDLAWPSVLLDVEVDGAGTHDNPDALYRDRHRQNVLTALGWTFLRFTWADVIEHPDEVVTAVARELKRLRESAGSR